MPRRDRASYASDSCDIDGAGFAAGGRRVALFMASVPLIAPILHQPATHRLEGVTTESHYLGRQRAAGLLPATRLSGL